MEFNSNKCEVLQFGMPNHGRTYTVNGRALGDFGIHVHGSLKVGSQLDSVVKKGFDLLAFFEKGIESKCLDIMMQLYK